MQKSNELGASLNTGVAVASGKPRKTLGLTGVTINAMALIAPGALMWLLYPAQAASVVAGWADIWPGVLGALVCAVLTARSLGELARRYPEAGLRSAYHYAEQVFKESTNPHHPSLVRLAKFITAWSAHLYYWIYPGVMIAFLGILSDTLLHFFGYNPTLFGKLILTFSFSAFIGFLALRGITGSIASSVALNVVQLAALLCFGALAFAFRSLNPLHLAPADWVYPDLVSVILPKSLEGFVFQAAVASALMLGFEASASFGAQAANPGRDVPRAAVLALLIQGALAYLTGYLAAGLALNLRIFANASPGAAALAASGAPLGDLALQMGDALLEGNGPAIMLAILVAALLTLIGAALTAVNNGARISFSMALDQDMPDVLSFLHPKYATPYVTVWLLSGASALVASLGAIFGPQALLGIILAANLGAFILYAMLCILTITAFAGSQGFNPLKHAVIPCLGLAANLGLAAAFPWIGLRTGGVPGAAATIALVIAAVWLAASLGYYWIRNMRGADG